MLVFAASLAAGVRAAGVRAASPASPGISSSTHQVLCDGVSFTLPQGLNVTKVAGPPLVKWPIVGDWDSKGRLVVAESGGVGWPIQEHNKQQLHRIIRLVDGDGDGIFDERIVVADSLAFPEGVLCLGNDILVAAPPVIWKLTDADGDGRCEERKVWFDATTVTNCANDLHGPYLGRDGWIYWCKGAFGQQTHELLDGRTVESTAAHIYRRRLSGGPIEPLISGGMDNPVEVAFLESGDKFFTSTFLHHPGNGLRDGIGHAVYGSVFGKDHRVIDGLARTGELMEPAIELGPAAPSGLMAASEHCKSAFGVESRTPALISALFNLHKVTLHQLRESGSSYESTSVDLIRTDRADFHPTDVLEGRDGSLLLIDTGGWYELCCPTSRVDQKTASGGIYRIEPLRDDVPSPIPLRPHDNDFYFDGLTPQQVFQRFDNPRPWIRRTARERFQRFGNQVIPFCQNIIDDPSLSLSRRKAAIWALCRLGSSEAAAVLVNQLESEKPADLLLPLLHSISILKTKEGGDAAEALLRHPSMAVRRVAAQVLGRIAGPGSAPSLLAAMQRANGDRHLQHSLIYALIELGRRHPNADFVSLADGDAALNAALVVTRELGQAQAVDASTLVAGLGRDATQLQQTTLSLLKQRPDAIPLVIPRLQAAWAALDSQESEPPKFLSVLLQSWQADPKIRSMIKRWYSSASEQPIARQFFLADQFEGFYSGDIDEEDWVAIVESWLKSIDSVVEQRWLASLKKVEYASGAPAFASLLIGQARKRIGAEALEWLSGLPPGTKLADAKLAQIVILEIAREESPQSRLAADVLDRVMLTSEATERLLRSIGRVPARHLATVIECLYRSGDARLQIDLLNGLRDLPAARTLRDDYLTSLTHNAKADVRQTAKKVSEYLIQPPVDIRNAVSETLATLPQGDSVRGLEVFRGSKAACSSCHQMGYIGENVGPVLTKIGGSRTAEALLEAIMFPSSRLEQSYRSTRILTIEGQVYSGLVEDEDDDRVRLRIAADRVVSIPIEEIDMRRASEISIMPNGIRDLLTDQQLADLLALLQAAK